MTLSPKLFFETLLIDAVYGALKTTFHRFPCHWLPVRVSQMKSSERMKGGCSQFFGYLTYLISPWSTFYFSYSAANSTMNTDALCLKDLPLSFIFYASGLSPKPDDSLNLFADTALNFRWFNTLAEKSQVVGLAKYPSLLAFMWTILGRILGTTHRRSPVSTA